ncbi:hypothetical protein [Microbacterium sp. AK031]|uniref:hypothetical protein n=1 Tax=Microbacterium sp. AK031 TaxID=2723076 RepID=UPI0021693C7D|nr:hypothetical protein [Microbacterium sp. AK031]MCS3841771.1 hypothetical protein [Microbacterium sp. AK031]
MVDNAATTSEGISRRTVTKAMAWALPAIAVAAPIPAFAASGLTPTITPGAACKAPGNSCNPIVKGYSVPATVHNPSDKTIYVTAIVINVNTSGIAFGLNPIPPLPWEVPAGGSLNVNFNATSGNSANLDFELGFSVTWGHAADGSDTEHDPIQVTVTVPATPPDCCK